MSEKYPECEKLHAHQSEMDVIRGFLEWAGKNGMELGHWDSLQFMPVNQGIGQHLKNYFEIDMAKVEQERRAMLASYNNQEENRP